MEAKCQKCKQFFPASDIVVSRDGLFCEEDVPDTAHPLIFSFQVSWAGIMALIDYIDGGRSLDTLEIVDTMREKIDLKIMAQIRGLIGGEIRQSDSKSMESGDGEY